MLNITAEIQSDFWNNWKLIKKLTSDEGLFRYRKLDTRCENLVVCFSIHCIFINTISNWQPNLIYDNNNAKSILLTNVTDMNSLNETFLKKKKRYMKLSSFGTTLRNLKYLFQKTKSIESKLRHLNNFKHQIHFL